MEPQRLHFSVQGEFITNLALEQCYESNRIAYAIRLLMGCLHADGQSEADCLWLAIQVLSGKLAIKGTYPGPDYRIEEIEHPDPRYDLTAKLHDLVAELHAKDQQIYSLTQKLNCVAEALDSEQKLRKINQVWREDYGESDDIFPDVGYNLSMPKNPILSSMLDSYLTQERIGRRSDDYGWLDPQGRFYPVDWGEHQGWAFRYLQKTEPSQWKHRESVNEGGDYLVSKGWILLHSPHAGVPVVTHDPVRPMTKAQREFLFGYYTDRNLHDMAKRYLEDD